MLRSYLRLLRTNRNFRLLWLAQLVSELGDWFYSLAVYNLLLDLTGSKAQSVGLAVVLQVLPHTLDRAGNGRDQRPHQPPDHHDRGRYRAVLHRARDAGGAHAGHGVAGVSAAVVSRLWARRSSSRPTAR